MERAILITVDIKSENDAWNPKDAAAELEELAKSVGIAAVKEIICQREGPTADFYIGKGKVLEIAEICRSEKPEVVIFNNDLSPTHQRNLEEVLNTKTIDRTQLILDIFAKHARSQEGKTQVELAQLQYLLPRLAGKGIILSRLGGGVGTRGPGEQKLEVDRRRIREKITRLKKELGQLHTNRVIQRKKRIEAKIPGVCIVGYTNAGKSTLLNALTGADQLVRDSLFTTLDTTSRILTLNNNQKIIISDTVGFLHRLPHHLIEAFKATLEEVREAQLLLHLLDISDPLFKEHAQAVYDVLKELDSNEKPIITVLNKIDKITDRDWIASHKSDFKTSVVISALHKENLNELVKLIENKLETRLISIEFEFPLNRMDLVNLFYREGRVNSVKYSAKHIKINASVTVNLAHKINELLKLEG